MTQQSRHELMHVPEMFKEFLLNMEHLFPAVVIRQIYYKWEIWHGVRNPRQNVLWKYLYSKC